MMSYRYGAPIVRRVWIFRLRHKEACPACLHFPHGWFLE